MPAEHRVVQWLWQVVGELTHEERKLFLKFFTGGRAEASRGRYARAAQAGAATCRIALLPCHAPLLPCCLHPIPGAPAASLALLRFAAPSPPPGPGSDRAPIGGLGNLRCIIQVGGAGKGQGMTACTHVLCTSKNGELHQMGVLLVALYGARLLEPTDFL